MKIDSNWKIGIVTSRFNEEVTQLLLEGALAQLKDHGVELSQIDSVSVPGAVEIPLAAQLLLRSGCDGVITLGAVIRGETTHYDYVCNSVERGCSQLMLTEEKPVIFGVLTTENDQQAMDRVGGRHGHKGKDAADTLVEMLNLVEQYHNKR